MKQLFKGEVQSGHRESDRDQTFTLFMTLQHTRKPFDVASLNRRSPSHLPPAECYSCVPLLFMSQPFHSADLQPVVRLAVLAGTICSPSHSLSHTHKHRYRTHAQTKTHGPAAWYMVPARGRQLHLSLSNLDPLAQQQLAPISSPLGPGFIKETVMDTAAWSRAASSSHH